MVDGEELQPTYWSASYFSIAPEASITISVNVPEYLLAGKKSEIKVNGWNVEETVIMAGDQ